MSSASRVADALPLFPAKIDRVGVLAMVAGTLITAWSGVLVRLIDVGPFAAGAWRVGLVAAGAFGAAQAVQEGATIGYKQEVNPDFKVDDAITDIKDAALGGAAFEVGGAIGVKVLGAAWRHVFGADPAKAAALPLPVHDAGTVAERASDLDANNPFRTGTSGDAAHNEAVATIDTQIANGDKPELPASAQAELQARTGDVFVPPANDGELPRAEFDARVRRRAEAIDPETFTAANALDNRIATARNQLSELQGTAAPAPTLAQSQISDLQSELDAITGKRRSSPRAQALRDQISELQATSERAAASEADRNAGTIQTLRDNLNDLVNSRGRLGPKVNAATKQAEAEAQAMGFKPVDEAAPVKSDAKPSHSGNPFELQPGREGPVARGKNAPMPARARRNAKSDGKIAEVLPPPVAPSLARLPSARLQSICDAHLNESFTICAQAQRIRQSVSAFMPPKRPGRVAPIPVRAVYFPPSSAR